MCKVGGDGLLAPGYQASGLQIFIFLLDIVFMTFALVFVLLRSMAMLVILLLILKLVFWALLHFCCYCHYCWWYYQYYEYCVSLLLLLLDITSLKTVKHGFRARLQLSSVFLVVEPSKRIFRI